MSEFSTMCVCSLTVVDRIFNVKYFTSENISPCINPLTSNLYKSKQIISMHTKPLADNERSFGGRGGEVEGRVGGRGRQAEVGQGRGRGRGRKAHPRTRTEQDQGRSSGEHRQTTTGTNGRPKCHD